MAEAIGSAVAGETVSRVTSYLVSKQDEKMSKRHRIERLEMAHSEMEFALERSSKWPIIDKSLLFRRRMLKRKFEECSEALDRCKLRVLQDEESDKREVSSAFPYRLAYAARSLFSFLVTRDQDEPSSADVRMCEWFADRAAKFLRDVESGITLWHNRFFDPLIRRALSGEFLMYDMVRGSQQYFFEVSPFNFADRGVETRLSFRYADHKKPEKNFMFLLVLQLSESTDIIGVAIKCLQSLTTQFKSMVEITMKELIQLPVQDIHNQFVTPRDLREDYNMHAEITKGERPDPLCCKAHGHELVTSNATSSKISYAFPEQVILVHVQHYISPFECNMLSSTVQDGSKLVKDLPTLETSVSFVPHRVWEDLGQSSVVELDGGERREWIVHTDASLHQVHEMVLPEAIDCFKHQAELTTYTTWWLSAHGGALFKVRKMSTKSPSAPKTKERQSFKETAVEFREK